MKNFIRFWPGLLASHRRWWQSNHARTFERVARQLMPFTPGIGPAGSEQGPSQHHHPVHSGKSQLSTDPQGVYGVLYLAALYLSGAIENRVFLSG